MSDHRAHRRIESWGAAALILSALAALIWANSDAGGYAAFRRPLQFSVDDGLMSLFFLLVGLELRWELRHGVLANARVARLPVLAAIGGVLAPAAIYLALNPHAPMRNGWGISTATDIAFAVGVLALLGPRVSGATRVLLLAIAIADDLIAILIIAVFYSGAPDLGGLLLAVLGVGGVLLLQRLGVRAWAQALPAALIWIGLWRAHIHPSIAGAVLGLLLQPTAPAGDFESMLQPWVAFVVLPLFALVNAGITINPAAIGAAGALQVTLAVALALALGKPLGIGAAALWAARLGLAHLPRGVGHREMWLIGSTAGIGFTMAIFIANLAFTQSTLLDAAKLGVLLASTFAAALSLLCGRAWRQSSS